jgi:hypothetical protein
VRFKGTPPWVTKACTSVSSASARSRAIGFLIRIFGTFGNRALDLLADGSILLAGPCLA